MAFRAEPLWLERALRAVAASQSVSSMTKKVLVLPERVKASSAFSRGRLVAFYQDTDARSRSFGCWGSCPPSNSEVLPNLTIVAVESILSTIFGRFRLHTGAAHNGFGPTTGIMAMSATSAMPA